MSASDLRQLPLFAGVLLLGASLPAQSLGRAPEFALRDLDGKTHASAGLRGRIVVLEWTCHRCPQVDEAHEGGHVRAAKKATEGDDVAWLCVDSNVNCAEERSDAAAWAGKRGLREPYLLDPDGRVGRAFAVRTMPHAIVLDAAGTVAFSGGLDGVAAAVAALRRGALPWPGAAAPRGITVKYADDTAHLRCEDAERLAAAGKPDEALAALAAAFAAGFATPNEVLWHPDFAPLRRDPRRRAKLHALLRNHARESFAVMADAEEKGEPLRITGTIRDAAGKPVEGALIHAYHTDATGEYAEKGFTQDNARLFAWLRTGADGRYELRTIRPAGYPDGPGAQHVHFGVLAGGKGTDTTIVFADDPVHRGKPPARAAKVDRSSGVATVVHDVVVNR